MNYSSGLLPSLLVAVLLAPIAGHSADPAKENGLFLHCFRPTYGQRVVLDPKAAQDTTPATPPTRLVTIRITPGAAFDVQVGDRHRYISSVIERKGGAYLARIEGAFGSGGRYSGLVELEKPFDTEITGFAGAVFPFRCVVSRKRDVEPFLKAQAALDAEKRRKATELTRRNSGQNKTE